MKSVKRWIALLVVLTMVSGLGIHQYGNSFRANEVEQTAVAEPAAEPTAEPAKQEAEAPAAEEKAEPEKAPVSVNEDVVVSEQPSEAAEPDSDEDVEAAEKAEKSEATDEAVDKEYAITIKAANMDGGIVSVDGTAVNLPYNTKVKEGKDFSLKVEAKDGYKVDSVKDAKNNDLSKSGSTYTIKDVKADNSVSIAYEEVEKSADASKDNSDAADADSNKEDADGDEDTDSEQITDNDEAKAELKVELGEIADNAETLDEAMVAANAEQQDGAIAATNKAISLLTVADNAGKQTIKVGGSITLKNSINKWWYNYHNWSISQNGIVEIVSQDEDYITIKGLKSGTVTVTYVCALGKYDKVWREWSRATQTFEIEVVSPQTLTYDFGDGDRVQSEQNAGTTVTVPGNTKSKDGFSFAGWESNEGSLYEAGETFTMPESDVTLTAKWNRNFADIVVTPYDGEYDGSKHGVTVENTIGTDVVEYSVDDGATWLSENPVFTEPTDTSVIVRVTNNGESETFETYVKITEYAGEITVTTVGQVAKYDGQPHGASVEVEGLPEGYRVVTARSNTIAFRATGEEGITAEVDTLVIENEDGVIVTEIRPETGSVDENGYPIQEPAKNFNLLNINWNLGKIIVNKATLSIESYSATGVYNGDKLTAGGKIYGLMNNETATLNITGEQTEIGTSDNTIGTLKEDAEEDGEYVDEIIWDGTASESNYTIVNRTIGKLTVTEANAITVTFPTTSSVYDAKVHEIKPIVLGLPSRWTAEVTFTDDANKIKDVGVATVNEDNTRVVVKNENGNVVDKDKIKIVIISGKHTVKQAPLTITVPSVSKTYDGTPLKATCSFKGLVTIENNKTETLDYKFKDGTGEITEVGSVKPTFIPMYNSDKTTVKAGNYAIVKKIGTLTVNEFAGDINVETKGGKFTYDGEEHQATVSVTGLPTGYYIDTAKSDAEVTDVDDEIVEATCDNIKIINRQGKDVTENLKKTAKFNYRNDTIQITPAPLTVTTESDAKIYDGEPLIAGGTVTGAAANETIGIKTIGTVTHAGEPADNNYELIFAGADENYTAKANNYEVTKEDIGTLNILPARLIVETDSAVKMYDGEPLTAGGKVEGILEGESYGFETTASLTEVGGPVANTYRIIFNEDDEIYTAQGRDYNVTEETFGNLVVTPTSDNPVVTPGGNDAAPTTPATVAAALGAPAPVVAALNNAATAIRELVNGGDEEVPLANVKKEHVYCILQFLLLLAALIVLIVYVSDMKRRKEEIYALEAQLNGDTSSASDMTNEK